MLNLKIGDYIKYSLYSNPSEEEIYTGIILNNPCYNKEYILMKVYIFKYKDYKYISLREKEILYII